jgi:hypothetical protein
MPWTALFIGLIFHAPPVPFSAHSFICAKKVQLGANFMSFTIQTGSSAAMSYQASNMENRRTPAEGYAPAGPGSGTHAAQYQTGGASHADASLGNIMNQFQAMTLPPTQPGVGLAGMASAYYLSPDGQVMLPVSHPAAYGAGPMGENGYGHPSGYLAAGQFNPFVQYPVIPFNPRGGATPYQRGAELAHNDVPALENRRASYSTNESTPATPYYTGIASRDGGPRIAVNDRSSYNTPSPQAGGLAVALISEPAPKSAAHSAAIDRTLDELLQQDPKVPKAVPAVFTPSTQMKTIEQSLENRIPGNRNVYIRGLHPTTDDELLLKFAERFGRVETSKAIIDTSTGACKGYVIPDSF